MSRFAAGMRGRAPARCSGTPSSAAVADAHQPAAALIVTVLPSLAAGGSDAGSEVAR